MLALEIEFLTGVSVAARPNRREEAEWPPHPDRLFQALVAAWGRDGEPEDGDPRRLTWREEEAALLWLEGLDQDGLCISATLAPRRDVVTVFVPPNDARTTGKVGDRAPGAIGAAVRVIPELRKNRQPRAFPAAIPEHATVSYVWSMAPGIDAHRAALARLAGEVTYLGHSHSLVRVALADTTSLKPDETWLHGSEAALRMPYPGRLHDLSDRFAQSTKGRIVRPTPSLSMRNFRAEPQETPSATMFDADSVTVFADDGGFVPSLEAFPLVAKRLRDALLKTADREGLRAPLLLSGHAPDGRPTDVPHIAIVPLADVGWAHSQGRLMGLALVWPREAATAERKAALSVLARFLREGQVDVGVLHFGRDGSWRLSLAPVEDRASLRFGRYIAARGREGARRWGTVLPAALDRHPKDRPDADLATVVARTCLNVGLPDGTIEGVEIEVHKHAAVKAAPSAAEVRKSLPADSPYRTKPLVHLVLTFTRPVRGPLILGAGRFRGLGLCLPLDGGE